ncbi:MAG: hypothetical protein NDJ90_06940 [Oligoflexia bacterium]|nr:hypothetical protein [Oligoflexia bacterium]
MNTVQEWNRATSRISTLTAQGHDAIVKRLHDLESEWDIDRALMANFAIVGSATLSAGLLKNRRWLALLGVQLAFLLNHAVRGWCPPASVFRRLGFRTQQEIQAERHLLLRALESALPHRDRPVIAG